VTAVIRTLFSPWRSRLTWSSLVAVVTSMPMGTITFSLLVALGATTIGLLITLPLALPVAWLFFVSAHVAATVERSRLAALADVDLADPVPPLRSTGRWGWFARLWERTRSGPRWKEIAYLLLLLPVSVVLGLVVLVVWGGSVALAALPLYVDALPGATAKFWLFEVSPGAGAVGIALFGLVSFVLAAPWITLGAGQLLGLMACHLLAPDRSAQLGQQVTRLESSRVAAVDSAETERRRIERDLHDGAQQRLVALAVLLGTAQERLETDPEEGKAMVADAHREAKAALAEIRDLVRGIHPVILEDRGLDASLSAIVARSPIPVELRVDVAERPTASVESAAYFIVSEALTNVAAHSSAASAAVTIARSGDTLVVEVVDDGVGGADPSRGTGLSGLSQRVSGMGGRMHVISPEGGPTSIIVELPCRS
jgi:signal transduction histidine kinase